MKVAPLYFLIGHIIVVGIAGVKSDVKSDAFCSSFCVCDMWYRLRRASCTSRHLYSVQTGVSNAVQALDLSNNSISALLNYELKNTGLVNLKYLNLSDNSISEIGSFAFANIDDLAVLDLSRNHLYYVLWDTFVDSRSLRILHLNGNRFGTRIPDLHSNSISELGLSDCQISHVNRQAFAGLKNLRKLDLSNNFMMQIDYREIEILPTLQVINLDNNPWSCGDMKRLLSHLEDRSIVFDSPCNKSRKTGGEKPAGRTMKKFEKMIDATRPQDQNQDRDREYGVMLSPTITWITDPPPPVIGTGNKSKSETIIDRDGLLHALADVSPLWIFAVGFSVGFVTSMLFTYIWVTGMISGCWRCPKIPRRNLGATRDNASQRISLLGGHPACPGTPPPPYRDVILNSSSYPTAPSVVSI
ncbi:immunoglobulin superfamily member 10-like isoform X1 [Neodiprion virginianus]|uniref:immunoglobulin superfamily member 10-like isoform X1 n=1 Tax=Neodiprion virginianus TaxID=2961670 RepID=UPI001EE710E1|nr:immunoglobulin superfamily member 10-like isoform X1 [Neodiprion virginianus]